jgi:hypothetical protein
VRRGSADPMAAGEGVPGLQCRTGAEGPKQDPVAGVSGYRPGRSLRRHSDYSAVLGTVGCLHRRRRRRVRCCSAPGPSTRTSRCCWMHSSWSGR